MSSAPYTLEASKKDDLILLLKSESVVCFGKVEQSTSNNVYLRIHAVRKNSIFGGSFNPDQIIGLNKKSHEFKVMLINDDDMKFFTKHRRDYFYLDQLSSKKIRKFYANS